MDAELRSEYDMRELLKGATRGKYKALSIRPLLRYAVAYGDMALPVQRGIAS
jgi:hypothetical protein